MADRELSNALASGEIAGIQLGGVLAADKVLKQSEVDAKDTVVDNKVTALDVRVTAIEATHELIVVASSTATSQEPIGTDTPLQIEFGALQTTTDIDVSATGAFTFKTTGKYIISPFFQYGRTGAASTSILLNRYLKNGVQLGESLAAKIDTTNTLVPWSSSIQFSATAGDVITVEIMRDSAGNNSGGLFSVTPTVVGWNIAPCASVQIYKAI